MPTPDIRDLPPAGDRNWYAHYTDMDAAARYFADTLAQIAAGTVAVSAPTTVPTLSTPIAGDGQATGAFVLAPGTAGTQIAIDGGAIVYEGSGTTYTVTGLTNGIPVAFKGRAYSLDATGTKLYGQWSAPTVPVTPTAAAAAGGGTVTDLDDSITTGTAKFTFVGAGWAAGSGTPKYNGGDHYNPGTDATQYFLIDWTSLAAGAIEIRCGFAGHHGQLAFSIDGGAETIVDLGTADGSRRDDDIAKTYTGISAGAHQVKGRVVGTAGVGTGPTVSVDRARITNLNGTVAPPTSSGGTGGGTAAVGALTRTGTQLLRFTAHFRKASVNHYMATGCGDSTLFNGAAGQLDTRTVPWLQTLSPGTLIRVPLYRGYDLNRFDLFLTALAANGGHLAVPYLANFINGGCGDGGQAYGSAWFTNNKWRAAGGQVLNNDTYESWLRKVVGRYAGNPSIGWIELGNEAPGQDLAGLKRFHDEETTLGKSIDPTRLFGSGTQPAWNYGGLPGYQSIHDVPNMDLISAHVYDYPANTPNHIAVLVKACKNLGKVGYVGEFGFMGSPGGDPTQFINGNPANTSQPCLSFAARGTATTNVLRTYMNGMKANGAAGTLDPVTSGEATGVTFQDYRDTIGAAMIWSITFKDDTICQTNVPPSDTATRAAIHDFVGLT